VGPGYMHFLLVLLHVLNAFLCAQCITSGLAMPHNLRKCSALRIRAVKRVVNKFIQAHMDFRTGSHVDCQKNRKQTRWTAKEASSSKAFH